MNIHVLSGRWTPRAKISKYLLHHRKLEKQHAAYCNIGQDYQPALTCLADYRKQRDLINLCITEVAQASPFHRYSFQTSTLTKMLDTEYKHQHSETAASLPF